MATTTHVADSPRQFAVAGRGYPSSYPAASGFGVGIYLLAFMWYAGPSGGLQPSHGVLVLLVALRPARIARAVQNYRVASLLGASFLLWSIAVNGIHWFFDRDPSFIWSSAFFAVNLGILLWFLGTVMSFDQRSWKQFEISILVALVIQAGIVVLTYQSGVRLAGSFNNPNQLGYWTLVMASMHVVASRRATSSPVLDVVVLLTSAGLIAASLSKAAVVGFAILLAIWVWVTIRHGSNGRTGAQVLVLAIIATIAFTVPGLRSATTELTDRTSARVDNIGVASDDSWSGRGYDRLLQWPEQLIVGAGEGAAERFTDSSEAKEIHSGLGAVAFAYGVPGLVLLGGLFGSLASVTTWSRFVFLIPAFVYNIAHQGFRFSAFWVLVAVAFALGGTELREVGSDQ